MKWASYVSISWSWPPYLHGFQNGGLAASQWQNHESVERDRSAGGSLKRFCKDKTKPRSCSEGTAVASFSGPSQKTGAAEWGCDSFSKECASSPVLGGPEFEAPAKKWGQGAGEWTEESCSSWQGYGLRTAWKEAVVDEDNLFWVRFRPCPGFAESFPTVPHFQDPSLMIHLAFTIWNTPLAKLLYAFPYVHSVSTTVSGNLLIVPKCILHACFTLDAYKYTNMNTPKKIN